MKRKNWGRLWRRTHTACHHPHLGSDPPQRGSIQGWEERTRFRHKEENFCSCELSWPILDKPLLCHVREQNIRWVLNLVLICFIYGRSVLPQVPHPLNKACLASSITWVQTRGQVRDAQKIKPEILHSLHTFNPNGESTGSMRTKPSLLEMG